MSTELIVKTLPDFLPTSFNEAQSFAQLFAKSNLCPKDYKGKPEDILIAMQMGARLGLDPFQAVQGIAVINGRSCVWGDAALAIVRSHPHCLSVREWLEGNIKDKSAVAYCEIERKGQQKEVRSFSVVQAIQAGLFNKAGTWSQYPERMLQMRARGFAMRDVFADALKGFSVVEEVRDYPKTEYEVVEDTAPRQPLSISHQTDPDILQIHLDAIKNSNSMDDLKLLYNEAKSAVQGDKSAIDQLMLATKERREYIKQAEEIVHKAKVITPQEAAKKAAMMTNIVMSDIATSFAGAIDEEFVNAYEKHTPAGEK